MQKYIFKIALVIMLFALTGCSSTETPPENSGLVEPYPGEGSIVAEINGVDYAYDWHYLFKIGQGYHPEVPDAGDINFCLELEVTALEAKELGLTFTPEEYNEALDQWQNMPEYYDALIADAQNNLAQDSVLTTAQKEEYQKIVEDAERGKSNYLEALNSILASEKITEAEFWQQEQPYIEKGLYSLAYANYLMETYFAANNIDPAYATASDMEAYEKYAKDEMAKLKKKYNVKER